MKKFFYIILPIICMILSLTPISKNYILVNASVRAEVVEIASSSDLNLIKDNSNGNFVLSSDVDITVSDSFFVDKFNGIIDGKGYTLTILGENITDSFSFISELSGSISNLKIVYDCDLDLSNESTYFSFIHTITETGKANSLELESSITTGSKGLISFGAIYNYGQISDCTSQGYISNEDKISTYSLKYGSFSIYNYGRIYNTYNSVNFNVVIYYGKLYLGGITTYNYGEINWCGNKGNINSIIRHHGSYYYASDIDGYIGGISAYSDNGIFNNVYNVGNLNGDSKIGGIVGYATGDLSLNNSYAYCDIYTVDNSGGIIGEIDYPQKVTIDKMIFKGKLGSHPLANNSTGYISGCIGYIHNGNNGFVNISNVLVDVDFKGDVQNYVSGIANITGNVNTVKIENCYIDAYCNVEIGEWVHFSYAGALNGKNVTFDFALLNNIYTNSDVSVSYHNYASVTIDYIKNGNLEVNNSYSSNTSRYRSAYYLSNIFDSQYIYNNDGISNLLDVASSNLPDFWQLNENYTNLLLFDNSFFEKEIYYEFSPEIEKINELDIYINNDLLEDSVIYPVGTYDVYIEWGEYVWDRCISILPTIKNIQDGETYAGSVTPYIKGGTITLDGKPYDGVSTITEPGTHVIEITGVNGYEQTINFSIGLVDSGIKNNDELISKGSLTFSGGTATLDGKPYTSGQVITEVGNHTIVITGSTGYSKTINFTILPIVTGIQDGQTYAGSVTPNIEGGTITLDGKTYDGTSTITEPGTHVIKITGSNGYEQTITFTIGLVASGIEDGSSYYGSASYDFSGGTATLDGKPYTSGQVITEVGHHTIVITGSTGYSRTIEFTVLPIVTGIQDGQTYAGSVTPNIEGGTITLDGKPYDGTSTITEPGTHVIKITGSNGYEQEIRITIDLVTTGIEENDKLTTNSSLTFSGGTATLDGKPYTSGQVITEVGHHTIVITGSDGYSKTINFTILPSVEGIEDGGTYSGSVTPNIEGGTITLDGKPYDGTSTITEPGEHIIKIVGSNGYELEIKFTIGLVASGIEDGAEYYESVSYDFSGGNATLDGKPYTSGQVITEVGHHTIVITGSDGYSKTINFTIKAIDYSIDSDDHSWSITIDEIHPNTTVTIDGKEVNGSYTENAIGNHTLIIKNGDYEEVINFTIKENLTFSDGDVFTEPLVLDDINGQVYVDGVLVEDGYRIDQNGTHEIRIVGTNGYESIIVIEYRNPNYLNAFMMLIPISIACVGIIYMAIRRRRVV